MGLPKIIRPTLTEQPTTSLYLSVDFEGNLDLLPESRVYALDAEGEIITSQKVNGGVAEMRLLVEDLPQVTMAIGPAFRDARQRTWPSLFNTNWKFVPGMNHYTLPSVPENIWRWWLVRSLSGKLWPEQSRYQKRFVVF